jgi:hypothetical protein
MPVAPYHLIDYVPGGAVQQTLARIGLLPENAPIPITVVLDCKNQLRWLQAGEVEAMAAFNDVIPNRLPLMRKGTIRAIEDGMWWVKWDGSGFTTAGPTSLISTGDYTLESV